MIIQCLTENTMFVGSILTWRNGYVNVLNVARQVIFFFFKFTSNSNRTYNRHLYKLVCIHFFFQNFLATHVNILNPFEFQIVSQYCVGMDNLDIPSIISPKVRPYCFRIRAFFHCFYAMQIIIQAVNG